MPEPVPDDIDTLKAALIAERIARQQAETRASGAEAMVAHLKLLIARMKRDQFGQSAERGRHLLDQLELQLEAKGPGYATFLDGQGGWQNWFTGAAAMEDQMQSQSGAAVGRIVEWHFAEQSALAGGQNAFRRRGCGLRQGGHHSTRARVAP
jgi:hypothetical protein